MTTYQRERTGSSSTERTITWPDATQNTATWSPERESVTYPDGTTVTTRYETDPRLGPNTRVPFRHQVAISGGPTVDTAFDRDFAPHCSLFTEDCIPFADPGLYADEVVETVTRGGQTWTETFQRAHLDSGSPVPATIVEESPLGRLTTKTLDDDGQIESVSASGIAPFTIGYDTRGRIETITRTDGIDTRTTTITYNLEGFVASVTDPLNRTTSYLYDETGRVTRQTFPDGRFLDFDYDDDGNLFSLAPPSKPLHTFFHDSVDRMRSYHPPVVPPVVDVDTTYAYNGDHQPTTAMPPDGQTVQVLYEPDTGKLDQIVTPVGNYDYTYDPATGQVDSVTDPYTGSLTYGYLGPLTANEILAGPVSGDVSWTYDSELRVETESIDGAHAVTFGYDDDGAPATVGEMIVATDPLNGNLTGTTLGGLTSTHVANGFGEPEQDTYEHAATTLYDLELIYDEGGRIHTKTEVRSGVTTLRCYEYDIAGRLTDVYDGANAMGCTGNVVEHYGYDDNGNRIEVENNAVNLTPADIVVDNQDRLIDYGSVSYTYTDDGDVATRNDGALTTYDHDAMGNLREVNFPGAQIEYVYDARNRRVGKRINGFLMQGFLYGDQLNPIAELTAMLRRGDPRGDHRRCKGHRGGRGR